jgi:hypothetical protein
VGTLEPEHQLTMKNIKIILLSGFVSGTMDALAAILFFTKPHSLHNISMLFRYIAKGVLGSAAFSTGLVFPIAGLILHYLIATIWSAIYLLIAPVVFKSGHLLAKTIVFAASIWIGMNGFILPVFGLGSAHSNSWSVMKSFLILVVCISAPIVIITEKRKQ